MLKNFQNQLTVDEVMAKCSTSYLAPFPSYGWLLVKFSLSIEGCLSLTAPLGVIP